MSVSTQCLDSGNASIFTFYLNIGSSSVRVYPLNFRESMLIDAPEGEEMFYRRKFSGSLTFTNLRGDFDILWAGHQLDPCTDIIIVIFKESGIYWTGHFSTTDGTFDIDRCLFTVTPLPFDDYAELLDEADIQYNILAVSPVITTRAMQGLIDVTFTRNRFLFDVIEYLADKIKVGVTVSSEFFNNATNYVTQYNNHLTLLTIAQKSDIKRPTSSDPAPKAMLSWNELMEILWGIFQVKWNYDSATDTINVEHISWFTSTDGLDIRNQTLSKATNKFSYVKELMPKYEKFAWMEASNASFTGSPIWYDSKCVNPDPKTNIKDTNLKVTTDLEYIINNPNSISDDGFVIFCNYEDGGDYYVELEASAVGSEIRLNMHLSWTNLHDKYFRHNRVLPQGYLNNNLITFWSSQKNIKQDCFAQVCIADNYDPANEITTELGETYLSGAKATVQQSELRPSGELKLSLLYGVAPVSPTAITDQKWIMVYEVTGASKSTFYAVCSEAVAVETTLHIYLTCIDAGSNTCDTANFDLIIAMGNTTGNVEVAWCEDSICVGAYHPDSSDAVTAGWVVDWIFDANSICV